MIPVIFGIQGTSLSSEEINFFRDQKPAGFIIFKRNIESKEQLTKLCSSLKELCSRQETLILIDQEGGRVQRYTEPLTKKYPPAQYFTDLIPSIGLEAALKAAYDSNYEMAKELASLGINVNCTPVADIRIEGAHNVISDRSFGEDPQLVVEFCKQVIKAHLDAGVMPIIKHIPGHGRSLSDSHFALPLVEASLNELENKDFKIFKELSPLAKFAMTAHIVYKEIDSNNPATLSTKVIKYIRGKIGFKGQLITDCITMKALNGTFAERAINSISAGCDYVLHCNGNMQEMQEIAAALKGLHKA